MPTNRAKKPRTVRCQRRFLPRLEELEPRLAPAPLGPAPQLGAGPTS